MTAVLFGGGGPSHAPDPRDPHRRRPRRRPDRVGRRPPRPEPRVAIIVGPAGGLTGLTARSGRTAAREARRWTSDVVTVITPNATWPAVKRALRGASIVVYLGHGNGLPSPYRDALYPPTQDGLGLNPVAGGDDDSPPVLRRGVPRPRDPARSGRGRPAPPPVLRERQLRAGAARGIARRRPPAGRQLRRGLAPRRRRCGRRRHVRRAGAVPPGAARADRTVDRIWRDAPTSHDHVLTSPSVRTPGYLAAIDPTRAGSGFNRSLVWRPGLTAADDPRRSGSRATMAAIAPIGSLDPAVAPSPAARVRFRAPTPHAGRRRRRGPGAGSRATLSLPITVPTARPCRRAWSSACAGIRSRSIRRASRPGAAPPDGRAPARLRRQPSRSEPGPSPVPPGRRAPAWPSSPPGPGAASRRRSRRSRPRSPARVVTPARARLVEGPPAGDVTARRRRAAIAS